MIDGPFAFALAAGMVAAFNPCGFAMLPVYLTRFIGLEYGGDSDRTTSIGHSLGVGAVVSSGFVAVFAIAGLAFTRFSLSVQSYAPWITVAIGLALIPLGVAMLRGYEPKISLPRLNKGTSGTGIGSMLLFGVSYGVVSISCTLPVFLAAVSGTFQRSSFISGVSIFITYGLGMALVLMALTVAIGLARNGLVARMKRMLPYVNRASGALLLVAGAYVAYYGYWEIRLNRGDAVSAGPVDLVSSWSAQMSTWVASIGATRLAVYLGVPLALLTLAVLLRKGSGDRARNPGGTT